MIVSLRRLQRVFLSSPCALATGGDRDHGDESDGDDLCSGQVSLAGVKTVDGLICGNKYLRLLP